MKSDHWNLRSNRLRIDGLHKQEVVDGEFPPLSIMDTHVACGSQRDGCQALPADRLPTILSRIHPEGKTGNPHFDKWGRFMSAKYSLFFSFDGIIRMKK
ncbi:hypothetical protein CN643_11745 [Parageobacillus yumthangensis]|nr:hypothetical protein CN643_11745 [Parageobacillus yumthangensis]